MSGDAKVSVMSLAQAACRWPTRGMKVRAVLSPRFVSEAWMMPEALLESMPLAFEWWWWPRADTCRSGVVHVLGLVFFRVYVYNTTLYRFDTH